jgi:putative DNA primase/helicase
VFLEILQRLAGEYSVAARTETIVHSRGSGIPNDIARLKGARLVCINEVEDGQRLKESLIKDLTGGDTISARFLHREFFDFRPQFKLWIRGNHKPQIRGTDDGIWRRIHLIPFTVTIPPGERDGDLLWKLESELPGILAWAVQGCLDWQRNGLQPPAQVLDAVSEYRSEMDVIGEFLEDCVTVRQNAQVTAKALYRAYRKWTEETGQNAVTQTRFGLALQERDFRKVRASGGVIYQGIELPMSDAWQPE